jgi:hypothetical protein
MHVSLFEIWKITQRCLEASGVPAGHDREGAFATMWLAEHGFPALDMMKATDLSCGSAWALTLTRSESGTQLEAGGLPLISLAIDAVDMVVADASETKENENTRLIITNACAPLYLLPFTARRAELSGVFTLRWQMGSNDVCITIAGKDVWIDGAQLSDLNDVTNRLDVTLTYCAGTRPNSTPSAGLLTPEQLSGRRRDSLSSGVEVDESDWSGLVEMSRAVLVPETAESRAHGAGGGNAND